MKKHQDNLRFTFTPSSLEMRSLINGMVAELEIYNHLIRSFSKILRENQNSLKLMDGRIGLFGTLIEYGLDFEKERNNPSKYTQSYSNMMSMVEDEIIPILKLTMYPLSKYMMSKSRRNLGVEILKYYIHQAKLQSPTHLTEVDLYQKRHLQFQRKSIKTRLIESPKLITEIYIPQLDRPLRINGDVKFKKWDILVLHQLPNRNVDHNTPWVIDLKKNSADYLLNYFDFLHQNRVTLFNNYRESFRTTTF